MHCVDGLIQDEDVGGYKGEGLWRIVAPKQTTEGSKGKVAGLVRERLQY